MFDRNYDRYLKNCEDKFNLERVRNIRNTDKDIYNCAGYALGTFSWYSPHDEEEQGIFFWGHWWNTEEEMEKVTNMAVAQMLNDFADLRIIHSLDECAKDEYAIAFRISEDGDFHYVRRARNGHWFHKMGAYWEIYTMTQEEVFSDLWCNRYNGRLVLFAKKFQIFFAKSLDK